MAKTLRKTYAMLLVVLIVNVDCPNANSVWMVVSYSPCTGSDGYHLTMGFDSFLCRLDLLVLVFVYFVFQTVIMWFFVLAFF